MKKYQLSGMLIALLVMIPGVVAAEEAPTSYMEMSSDYEAIRLALLADSMEGVAEHAKAIHRQASSLLANFEAVKTGIAEEEGAVLEAALQEIESAASNLSAASSLESAREDFFTLTKPMARYRKLVGDQDTVVAYCPMAQKAWIQPDGEIGNPYLGQEMPNCGEVVGG
ncbi:MAG: DUF3347 domain-containing protein [Thermoanaerobaculia bacterium]